MAFRATGAGTLSSIDAINLALAVILAAHLGGPAMGESVLAHTIGSGPEDWWIEYPDQHPNAGSVVDHPTWALDPLEEKPLIMLIHSSGCSACIKQEEDIQEVLRDLGDDVSYLDVLYDDDIDKTWTALEIYDPTGDPGNVPVTVLLTLAPGDDGDLEVAWHSYLGSRGEERIRSYLNDAIVLYEENSEG